MIKKDYGQALKKLHIRNKWSEEGTNNSLTDVGGLFGDIKLIIGSLDEHEERIYEVEKLVGDMEELKKENQELKRKIQELGG